MKEITGNLWMSHATGQLIAITTNGDVNSQGRAVMGRGVAKQAATRYPYFPIEVANHIKQRGNHVHLFPQLSLVTYPVKHHWNEIADLDLIVRGARELVELL